MVFRGFSGCLFKQAIQQKTYLKKGSFLFSQSLGCFIKYLISNCFLAKALTRLLYEFQNLLLPDFFDQQLDAFITLDLLPLHDCLGIKVCPHFLLQRDNHVVRHAYT